MKKFYSLFAILCTVGVLNAQVEIPLSDFNPTIGQDTMTYVNVTGDLDPTDSDFGLTGDGVTWDFSSLTPGDTVDGIYIDKDSCANGTIYTNFGAVYSASFWSGQSTEAITAATEPSYALKIDTTELVFRKVGGDIELVGWVYATGISAGSPTWVNSLLYTEAVNPTPFMSFPLKTGGAAKTDNNFNANADEEDPASGGGASQAIAIRITTNTTSNVVASGTLKLPYGDLENVVLVHWSATGQTADNQGTFGDGNADIDIYQWYQAENATYPMAQAYIRTKSRTSANLSATTFYNMYYRTAGVVSSVEKAEAAKKEFKVYPNPASRLATVSFKTDGNVHAKAEIIDIVGQTVMTIIDTEVTAGQHSESVDISDLPRGNYMIRAEVGNEVSVKKLIVE